jgi:hypothetical protein
MISSIRIERRSYHNVDTVVSTFAPVLDLALCLVGDVALDLQVLEVAEGLRQQPGGVALDERGLVHDPRQAEPRLRPCFDLLGDLLQVRGDELAVGLDVGVDVGERPAMAGQRQTGVERVDEIE